MFACISSGTLRENLPVMLVYVMYPQMRAFYSSRWSSIVLLSLPLWWIHLRDSSKWVFSPNSLSALGLFTDKFPIATVHLFFLVYFQCINLRLLNYKTETFISLILFCTLLSSGKNGNTGPLSMSPAPSSCCLVCLIAIEVASMLIAQGPLLSQHLHGLLDSEFNLLEGFGFHACFKFKHPLGFDIA